MEHSTMKTKPVASSQKPVAKHKQQSYFLQATGYRLQADSRGFTLIELIVVTGILALISGLMLANHARFGGAVLLGNLAYDVALSIRKAQVYGISVRGFGVESASFTSGYGVHFTRSSPTDYVLYADAIARNGIADSCPDPTNPDPASCEDVEFTTIAGGFRIADLLVGPPSGEVPVDSIDILFKRPEPDACISSNGAVTLDINGMCTSSIERTRIVFTSPRGGERSVVVEVTGQIAVQ